MPKRSVVRIVPANCKGCGICAHYCPSGVLEMSEGFTSRGYHPPRRKEGVECKGCRICELMCPDFAIFIEETKGGAPKAEETPVRAPEERTGKGGRGRRTARRGPKGGRE